MGINGGGFSGGGFSGGGFGQASNVAPANQYLGDTVVSAQAAGVAPYGAVWASRSCSSCDAAIRDMQAQINRLANAMNVAPAGAPDGKVGAGTVAALQRVTTEAMSRGIGLAMGLAMYNTPEAVAKSADRIRDILVKFGDARNAPPAPPYTPPAASPQPRPQPAPSPQPQFPMTLPGANSPANLDVNNYPPAAKPKSKLPWIIGGGVVLVGVIVAGVILFSPPKHAAEE